MCRIVCLALPLIVLASAADTALPRSPIRVEPAADAAIRFSDPLKIDNAWYPLPSLGKTAVRVLADGQGNAEVERVLRGTRTFVLDGLEVPCRIVEELELEDGVLVEVSRNYFAQDDEGAVHYFGEIVKDAPGGTQEPSWLVGGATEVGDPTTTLYAAHPSVFMPGAVRIGDTWRPEDLLPHLLEVDTAVGLHSDPDDLTVEPEHLLVHGWSGPGSHEVKRYRRGYGLTGHFSRDLVMQVVFSSVE